MNLHDYHIVIINSSAGKDSLVAIYEICRIAREQNYALDRIVVSHQDLGSVEWPGTKELAKAQAKHFGLKIYYSKRRDKNGYHETFLEYVLRRGKWPSGKQRYCTSDFKRVPGGRVVTMLTKESGNCSVLYVFGFRKEESPSRSKYPVLKINEQLSTQIRTVHNYLPVHDWSTSKVWSVIKENGLPYHPAYDLGMPRLSCCFCIFSPFDALVIAAYANPGLLDKYIEVEAKINHTFRTSFSLASVKEAIVKQYKPKKISNWIM